ncbi:MAG: substrate-binding domain-containing protein [Planctomycetales bacterium]|jgi:LacI family transcriptional regulator
MAEREREVALIMNINKPYDRKVVEGVARFTRTKSDWCVYAEDEPLAKIPDLSRWKGHGIIADLDDASVVEAITGLQIPVVNIGGAIHDESWSFDTPYVTTDNSAVAQLAAEHLLDRGFQNFAYCGLRKTPFNPWSRIRSKAFQKAVNDRGFDCSIYRGRHNDPRRWEEVQQSLCRWLEPLPKPLGLFACHDARARHVLESCRRLGLRVPDDVAILGVDNDEMMCELANPALSSIELGTDRIGFEAASLLDDLMAGKRVPKKRRWVEAAPVGVVMRASTNALAVDDNDVAEAIVYIRDHVGRGVQVSEVTTHVDLSRSTLDNRFKAQLGRSVHDEIERARLELVKSMLLNTTLTLAEISKQTGFGTVQYMATVFRRSTGHTPGQFRQLHQRER